MTVKITTRPNGPYLVEGECEVYDPTGARIDTAGQPRIALCRCGGGPPKATGEGTPPKKGASAAPGAGKKKRDWGGGGGAGATPARPAHARRAGAAGPRP